MPENVKRKFECLFESIHEKRFLFKENANILKKRR